ncbi:hypothetical protein Hanom_Chr07g00599551 [Helianthus anomalus]
MTGQLLNHVVEWAALWLHETMMSHGDKEIKEWMGSWVKRPFMINVSVNFDRNSVLTAISLRFDMYGNDSF